MSLLRDLKILTRESKYLPFIFASNPEDTGAYNETNLAKSVPSLTRLIGQAIIGCPKRLPPKRIDFGFNSGRYVNNEKWFFVNGICTNEETIKLNCQYLSELFGRNVMGIHNPTNGLIYDLTECVTGRTLDIGETTSKFLGDEIEKALNNSSKVRVIAHSQGGIIIDNTIRHLKFKNIFLNNLEVFTFASASDGETSSNELYQEHFANEEDVVARIGLLAPEFKPDRMFLRTGGKGHLLNANYLNAFRNGAYCNKKSRLFSLIKKDF